MKTVEELKQMKYDITRKMGDYLEELTEWTSHIEEREREDGDLYQKGLSDAWEMMKGVCLSPYEGGMEIDEVIECFGKVLLKDILRNNSASEAKEKYDAWKEKKEQIQVGDVVASLNTGNEYIVLYKFDDKKFSAVKVSGGDTIIFRKDYVTKTGKHYDLPWLTEQEQEEHDA